ncbi:hypothetical protein ACWESE_35660, partial [Streptomyces xanthochromogenes]
MEQRSEHQYMPLGGAATDPAYVPGLVPARAVAQAEEPLADEPAGGDAVPDVDEGGRVAVATQAGSAEDGTDATEAAAGPSSVESESDAASDAGADVDDGPSCEIFDRLGSIVAGRGGVRLRLMDE